MTSNDELGTEIKDLDETMRAFENDLVIFHEKVDLLTNKSCRRVMKALAEFPLVEDTQLRGTEISNPLELEVYTLGVNILQAKINAVIMHLAEQQQEGNAVVKQEDLGEF